MPEVRPDRRSVLLGAVTAGGAALVAGCQGRSPSAAPRAATSAAGSPSGGAAAASINAASVAPAGKPGPGDWRTLAGELSGPLIRPGDSSYPVARRLFDPRFDTLAPPSGIAYCRGPHDVTSCLAFVRRFRIPMAVRCGGHSYAGWSSTSGLIIDVSRMSGVSVSGTTATVGAGTRLIDLYSALAAKGRVLPGGSCPTVGVSGLTLGGGIGVVARAYGLTCDNLRSLQVVT
ncbi:MAG TPA: FAD-dependent oxidoreductase, partial [Streptosporangiaceae bacterium]|nr:FAD-dependent oxidoreductase [Streptosporangiaceae bacterium]